MDFASTLGFLSGLALIVGAILLGGNADLFVNLPGMMIVVGGTTAAILLTVRFSDVTAAFRAAYIVFTHDNTDKQKMIDTMLELSKISHRNGLLALSNVETNSSFLRRACMLIADASTEDMVRKTLQTEIDSLIARHYSVQDVFKRMAMYAPAFGMLGTLIGLIQMLSNLSDPATIGPAMAVAMLTTFYGSLLSSMVFMPIAGKTQSTHAAGSDQPGDHPRRNTKHSVERPLRQRLRAALLLYPRGQPQAASHRPCRAAGSSGLTHGQQQPTVRGG